MKCKKYKLDKKIQVLTKTTNRELGGVMQDIWTETGQLWVQMKPKRQNPLLDAENKENQVMHEMIARNNTIIANAKQRIKYGDRYFFIKNFFDIDENNRFMKIEAIENTKAEATVL